MVLEVGQPCPSLKLSVHFSKPPKCPATRGVCILKPFFFSPSQAVETWARVDSNQLKYIKKGNEFKLETGQCLTKLQCREPSAP